MSTARLHRGRRPDSQRASCAFNASTATRCAPTRAASDEEWARADLAPGEVHGHNAIRTSHYPPHLRLLSRRDRARVMLEVYSTASRAGNGSTTPPTIRASRRLPGPGTIAARARQEPPSIMSWSLLTSREPERTWPLCALIHERYRVGEPLLTTRATMPWNTRIFTAHVPDATRGGSPPSPTIATSTQRSPRPARGKGRSTRGARTHPPRPPPCANTARHGNRPGRAGLRRADEPPPPRRRIRLGMARPCPWRTLPTDAAPCPTVATSVRRPIGNPRVRRTVDAPPHPPGRKVAAMAPDAPALAPRDCEADSGSVGSGSPCALAETDPCLCADEADPPSRSMSGRGRRHARAHRPQRARAPTDTTEVAVLSTISIDAWTWDSAWRRSRNIARHVLERARSHLLPTPRLH